MPNKGPKVIISPVQINYLRLKDSDTDIDTKKHLVSLCNDCTDIFSKHSMGTGKTDLVQMSLQPKDNI